MNPHDPNVQRFMASMRAALKSYDERDRTAPDRHADTCPCPLCDFVRATRETVEIFDELEREMERKLNRDG